MARHRDWREMVPLKRPRMRDLPEHCIIDIVTGECRPAKNVGHSVAGAIYRNKMFGTRNRFVGTYFKPYECFIMLDY